ncbi:MAG: hypothetical protein H6736_21030 [Alphaproteobacteria bacterium]|nr:hypothetical protein [Alphaproteobacteria bacterium]
MADRRTPKPTGRRVRGYISDLVELSAPRALWTALVYHQDYRDDAVLEASAERVAAFARAGCPGVPPLVLSAPGVFGYDTGEIRSTRELVGASRGGIGWRAAAQWFAGAAKALGGAYAASGLKGHGSLDPHRVLVDYEGNVHVVGFGLPRLDLVDFLDDASLVPPTEALRYSAPESLEGAEEDFGTDLFVLGLIAARLGGGLALYGAESPTDLLAAAAEGEGRAALARHAPPEAVMAWLGPVLEPWPDQRPKTLAAAIEAAEAAMAAIEGDDLAAAMESLAEIASDVEVDLPRGWALPVPPPPLDDEHRDTATRRLKRAHGEASRALERTRARMEPLEGRDWSLSRQAAEAREEAVHHATAAERAVTEAAEALERAEAASTHESLDAALAEGEDACDRARGANSEALRALDRATNELQKAEDARAAGDRQKRGERAAAMVAEVEALLPRLDALDARTAASLTADARAEQKALTAALRAYAEAPDDASALQALEERTKALHHGLPELERQADEEVEAAVKAAAEAAEQARLQKVAEQDARIAALDPLPAVWSALEAEVSALGGDPAFEEALAGLRADLASARDRLGDADPSATRAALDPLVPGLQAGEQALRGHIVALRERAEAEAADAAHRTGVAERLAGMRAEAADLAKRAKERTRGVSLAHPHAEPVTDAIDAMREALADAERASEALQSVELEPDDDPDAVLDAALTHLQSARDAAATVEEAASRAVEADRHETERLGHEQAERARAIVQHREQLASTGVRVAAAAAKVREALDEAEAPARPLLAALAARGSVHLGPLERALDALRQHHALLLGRQTNWEQMAEPAGDTDDPDQLEALVATGEAEASFAEADLTDLPDIVDVLQAALALAQAEQQVHEDALEAARARIATAMATADEAEALLPGRIDIPAELRDDDTIQSLEDDLLRSAEAARGSLATVRSAAAHDPSVLPEERWLADLEAAAALAHTRADDAAGVYATLAETVEERLAAREAARKAREAARDAAREALVALRSFDEQADVALPTIDDEAVAERVDGLFQALRELLDGWEPLPDIDPQGAPEAARDALVPLVEPRRAGANAIRQAHDALLAAITTTTARVASLREATGRGEAAADRAAVAGAAARELLRGLMGSWPHLVGDQEALKERVAAIEAHARQASTAAEEASEAEQPEVALDAAGRAEQAANQAEAGLEAARPLADALAARVEEARKEAAEADEHRRLELIEEARELTATVTQLREGLDEASQEAVTALEDSPSVGARRLWEAAEEHLDAANALLQRIDDGLQGVFSASHADEAAELLARCRGWVEGAHTTVDPAREAVHEAAVQARKDVAANEQLVVELQGTRIDLDAIVNEVEGSHTALAKRVQEVVDEEAPVPEVAETLASVASQLGHLRSAREELGGALEAAMQAADEPARTELRQVAQQALARSNAARNTARAHVRRLEERLAQLEAAEQERRQRAIARLGAQHQSLTDRLDRMRGAAAVALDADDAAALPDAIGAVRRALEAALELASGSEVRAGQADPETPSRMLEHLVRQGDRALERLDERESAVQVAVAGVEDARRARRDAAEAAHRAFVERREAMQGEVRTRLADAEQVVQGARRSVESARPLLGNSPAASALKAWTSANEAVEASEAALERAREALGRWPATPSASAGDDARQASQQEALDVAERVRSHAADAIAEAGAVAGLIDLGMRSAEALAGILDDAGAVRGRYQTFESQLEERRTSLDAAMAEAPVASASRLHREARIQIEEIAQTLAEARASLEELGEASSADEAEALLEVATVSLDIAESVLEYALPTVDRAVREATEEARATRERRERIEAARAALDVLLAPERTPEDAQEAIGACLADAALLEHHEAVKSAVASLSEAVEAYTLTFVGFEHTVPDDAEPDVLEALVAEVTLGRAAVDATRADLDAALTTAAEAVAVAQELDRQHAEALDAARARFREQADALEARKERVRTLLEKALAAAEAWPDAGVMEKAALEAAVESVVALEAPLVDSEAPADWDRATETTTVLVETARGVDVDGPLELLEDALDEARLEAEARHRRLEAATAEMDALRERLSALRETAAARLKEARTVATDYPLEAGLPLAALEAAQEAIGATSLPDALPSDPDAAETAVKTAASRIERLEENDLDELLVQVRAAVGEAQAEEQAQREALEEAHARLDAAREQLQARQDHARLTVERLAHAREWPEVAEAWEALESGAASLEGQAIEKGHPLQLPIARKLAERAEATATRPPDIDDLAKAVEDALAAAVASRAEARERLQAARSRTGERIAALRARIPDAATLPSAEPVRAAHRALGSTLAHLEGLRVDEGEPEAADTAALVALAEKAEDADQKAASRDVDGLLAELDEAVREAAAAAARDEQQRVDTLAQARSTLAGAIGTITTGLEARSERIGSLRAASDPLGRRSEAREALEAARATLAELRTAEEALDDRVTASEAISVAFDAEMQLASAEDRLRAADAALDALLADEERLARAKDAAADDHRAVVELLASLQGILDDVPEPAGDEAVSLRDALDSQALDVEALRATAELALEAVQGAKDGQTAADAGERLRTLINEVQERFHAARQASTDLREANRTHAERQAAMQREALAAARDRAVLASERAGRALEDVGRLLADGSDRAGEHRDDPTIDGLLTELARRNEDLLAIVDEAREHAQAAGATPDPGTHAGLAVKAADRAEAEVARARAAVAAIEARAIAIFEEEVEADRQREAAILARRDTRLPELRAQVDRIGARIERFTRPEPMDDDGVMAALARVDAAFADTRSTHQEAEDALGVLASARPDDVDDFLKDAERALAATEKASAAMKAALTALVTEQDRARARGAELALEEARGRAWEACQLAQSLSADLTRARAALPEVPVPTPPRVREALDRLAEVERRLWRAGQRASEARERAGGTDDLEAAQSAAEAAEKAVGPGYRWEREIDRALAQLTELLQPGDVSDVIPRSERLRNLRRGRIQAAERQATPAPAPDREHEDPEDSEESEEEGPPVDNPTEALLRRLREGKSRGETGRERLRRLRRQGVPDEPPKSSIREVALEPVSLPESAQDYPSLQEFEDYQATAVDHSPALRLDQHAPIEPRQRRRRPPPPEAPPVDDPSEATVGPELDDPSEATLVGLPPGMDAALIEDDDDEASATLIAKPPAKGESRRRSIAGRDAPPGRPPVPPKPAMPDEDDRTQAFPVGGFNLEDDPDFEDAKTQAFNREMIDALLGKMDDEAPKWGEEESSTKWDTRDQKGPKR